MLSRLSGVTLTTLILAGCSESVVGGERGAGGAGGAGGSSTAAGPSTSTGEESGGVAQPTLTAQWNTPDVEAGLCERYSGPPMPCDLPDMPEDALVLVIDSNTAVCEPPFLPPFELGPKAWRVVLAIPPAKQAVGSYILTEHPDIFARYETKHEGGGTGSGLGGLGEALEILAIDGTNVTIRTTGLTSGSVSTHEDGTVTTWDSDGEYASMACE
jgi:hypothetical protein